MEASDMGLLRLTHTRPEVSPDMTVGETAKVMAEAQIGAIVVMSGKEMVGIFTERDLLSRVVAERRDPAITRIKDVMTTNIVTVPETTSVAKAAAIMRSGRMRHLVIVDDTGQYVGMLAQRHLLYELMNDLAMKVDDFANFVMTDGPGG